MPRAKRVTEDEVPYYHVQLIDAERGRIRFGPFTQQEFLASPVGALGKDKKPTPEAMADDIRSQIASLGLISTLTALGVWGGIEIHLKGDDDTDYLIAEVEAP